MKLLSYDRAKLKLEPEELHTKQLKDPSNTWHCEPVYACTHQKQKLKLIKICNPKSSGQLNSLTGL